MRINIQYIPLNQLKPDLSGSMTQRIQQLRRMFRDCAHLMAVRKNSKDGSYLIVAGLDRYHYLQKHTSVKKAPCIVDTKRGREPPLLEQFPFLKASQMTPAGWSMIRTFLKQEPRFRHLTPLQQMKVLIIGARYKHTVIRSMKSKVNELLENQ